MPATLPRLVGRTSDAPAATTPPAAPADVLPSDLDALLSAIQSSDRAVSLWRVNERGRAAYLRRMPGSEFDLDEIRDRDGGGLYELRAHGPDNRIERQVRFAIEGAPKARATDAGELSRVDRLEGMLAQLLERQAASPAPTVDPLVMALKIVEVMKPAAAPAVVAPASDPIALFTLFDKMLDVRERIAGDVEPAPPPSALERIAEPMMNLLGRAADANDQQMKRRTARPAAPAPTTPAPSPTVAPAPGAEAAAVAAVSAAPADPLAQLAQRVPAIARGYLASCARGDKDPALYADVVLDALPDDVVQQLPALLAGDDAAARLCALIPQWTPYPGWIGELVQAIRAALAEDDAPDGGAAA